MVVSVIVIVTTRLRLRVLVQEDLPAFLAYRREPGAARYQSWSADYSAAAGHALIKTVAERPFGGPDWVNVGIELSATGELIGDVALRVEPDRSAGEVGFTLASSHHGHGYGREAVGALCVFAVEDLKLPRLFAITDARNVSAIRLLGATAFRKVGFHRQRALFKGELCDELLFERP
jgi:RimJ/RimL family protein N-acetyltransferase